MDFSPNTESERYSPANELAKDQPRLPKKLIVCCDGTWMDSDNGYTKGSWGQPGKLQNASNVTRICRAIQPEDEAKHPQIVYYQSGIGTGLGLYDHLVGGATGVGLSENIREAYAFLAMNYSPKDKISDADSIFLLGFSRGAYTARSLGGFIAAVGILTREAMPYFYDCFLDWENAGNPDYQPQFIKAYIRDNPDQKLDIKANMPPIEMAGIRANGGIDKYMFAYRKHLLSLGLTQIADIQCIGVWDTVGALGIPVNPSLQRTLGLPAFIKQYRWFDTRVDNCVRNAFQALALDEHRFPYSPALWELPENGTTNLKQCWFAGGHSNIGGSYDDYGQSNITLAWMMDQLSGKTAPNRDALDPKDWIRFNDSYIDYCYRHAINWYDEQPHGDPAHRSWSKAKVYESDTFPQSLAGSRVRTPGLYHRTDYNTGDYTAQLLVNTHETIHSSVRARVDLGGRAPEPSVFYQKVLLLLWRIITFQRPSFTVTETYRPNHRRAGPSRRKGPLFGWKLFDGHASHAHLNDNIDAVHPDNLTQVVWKYEGKALVSAAVLAEDTMAADGYEARLLQHDQEIANKILFSNHGWRWWRTVGENPRHSHTL